MTLCLNDALALITEKLASLPVKTSPLVIAIDGRCASGKTTLATALGKRLSATVISCDDFFLPPEKRTEARLLEIGGNMERERLLCEVLLPLQTGKPFTYQRFDCHTASFSPVSTAPASLVIVEGSYACHKDLMPYYDFCLFLTVSPEEQKKRIQKRNPQNAGAFFERWIPLEERYFAAYRLEDKADLTLSLYGANA